MNAEESLKLVINEQRARITELEGEVAAEKDRLCDHCGYHQREALTPKEETQ